MCNSDFDIFINKRERLTIDTYFSFKNVSQLQLQDTMQKTLHQICFPGTIVSF